MFMAAASLDSKLTSTPFTDYVTSTILEPFNMSATTYFPTTSHLSDSFITLENGTIVEIPHGVQQSFDDIQVNAGAGGIVTPARDMMKWLEFMIVAVSSFQFGFERERSRLTSLARSESP